MIAVIDYGAGNLGSILNMLKRFGAQVRIASKPRDLVDSTAILLPGIGNFDSCAKNLKQRGFSTALEEPVLGRRVPLLGICVGAQLLTKGSEEGDEPGLGWIDAVTLRFDFLDCEKYKVPHMGWNIAQPEVDHRLFIGLNSNPRFYFTHSYYIQTANRSSVLCTTCHGVNFASGIYSDNIAGVQFHPEKSHRFGMQMMKNFSIISDSK